MRKEYIIDGILITGFFNRLNHSSQLDYRHLLAQIPCLLLVVLWKCIRILIFFENSTDDLKLRHISFSEKVK